ncbi:DAK2 domain fusion protein YloV [Ligilactobacillus salitolerans]|uniref:DAK2 domain fusion protein YloV n=1 Tax=Ligilactobacillus salitolerans TaxID=1808352 RepID=A0A401IRG8_9LACO|nr:DAK2 domain-containing protein [Ligilactobacillus salitolerans]GBG94130.1 DAK2 domain fusion protein YloV [Ligilactobacillus salitolerans]
MKVVTITDTEFRKMVSAATNRLNSNAEFINSLNVFPVPDGDTGTNMSLSFASGAKYVNESTATAIGDLTSALAKGLLMGARGNSGVILSQVFRGFARSTAKKQTLSAVDLADAISTGVETAYKAVMKPTEGTILTVARKAAEAARKCVKESDDCVEVMEKTFEAAKEALATTPDLLPVLKEVGVVDSGGQGLTFVYEAFSDALSGKEIKNESSHQPSVEEMEEMVNAEHHKSVQSKLNTEDIKYGYCTEIMVRIGGGRLVDSIFDYDTFRNHLAEIGDSLLVIADDEVVKVHVHTEHPGDVLAYGQKFGSLIKVKVDNMRLQHETILENDEQTQPKEDEPAVDTGDYGIISISSGAGLAKIFKGLGVTEVLDGGQTMNPSTEDIMAAIKKTGSKKVIILPNNKNIFMAAQQAAEVSDIPATVVKTKSISQGMTALLAFDPAASLADNQEMMTEDLDTVVSGQITQAVRDTTIDGQSIKKDDYMGLVDGKISVTDRELFQATVATIKAMLDEDSEIVTIIYGQDGTKEQAQAVQDEILAENDELEFELHEGDQPLYPYLISVE